MKFIKGENFDNKKIKEIGDYLFESLSDISGHNNIAVMTVVVRSPKNETPESEIRLVINTLEDLKDILYPVVIRTKELGIDWNLLLEELAQ